MNNFHRSVTHTFKYEGGWSDHPSDPGGATNRGITLAVYRDWKKNPNATKDELRRLSEDEAREIYLQRYWHPVRGDELPHGIDCMVFDMGVNAGTGTSVRHLQEVLGVAVDGRIGPQTLAAARAADPRKVTHDLKARHERYYRNLKTFDTFGRGWLTRLDARHQESLALLDAGSASTAA